VLIYQGAAVPWIHDLDRLRNLIADPAAWSVTQTPLDLASLTAWGTEARYPQEQAEPEAAAAAAAIAVAQQVLWLVMADLLGHGLLLSPGPRPASPTASSRVPAFALCGAPNGRASA
jgi:hypothetical protein